VQAAALLQHDIAFSLFLDHELVPAAVDAQPLISRLHS
jgi:hypothetical protein